MRTEPFDFEKWKKNTNINVITKDGREAEIVNFSEGIERPFTVIIDGRYYLYRSDGTMSYEHDEDTLHFVIYEEDDLTDFEKSLKSIIDCHATTKNNNYDLPYRSVKRYSKCLKQLAEKEMNLPKLVPSPTEPGVAVIENGYLKYGGYAVNILDLLYALPVVGEYEKDKEARQERIKKLSIPEDTGKSDILSKHISDIAISPELYIELAKKGWDVIPKNHFPRWKKCEWKFGRWEVSDENGYPIISDGNGYCINLLDLLNLPKETEIDEERLFDNGGKLGE